ncbi:TPA: hypothetical protein ACW7X5_002982 [Elizabethkingia meningoseptica]
MSIINLLNYKSKISTTIVFVFILLTLFSCSRELTNEPDAGANPVQLTFNIEGVEDVNPLAVTASKEPISNNLKRTEGKKINFDGFNATVSLEESRMASTPEKNAGLLKTSSVQRSNSPMAESLTNLAKYRVVLYDRTNNPSTFFSSTLGTAGTPLSIPVEKGKDYDWAVFSYNDTSDPGTSSTTVQTDQRDLLHASSTTGVIPGVTGDGQVIDKLISVRLKHKLARIDVSVDASNYPATITALNANLGSLNYFQKGTMDLKTGTISNQVVNSLTSSTINFTGTPSLQTASYYTAGTSTINPFSIQTSLTINTAGGNKSLNNAPFNWSITSVPGTKYTAKVNLLPTYNLANFKILSVGSTPYMVDKTSSSGVWQAMTSPANFGPTGTVTTTDLNWNINVKASSFGLSDLLTGGYKLLFVGYAYSISAAEAADVITFVNNGGTVIWFTENSFLTYDQTVWKNFAGTGTATSFGFTGNTNNNTALTGKFGDARNSYFGNVGAVGYGIKNYDPAKVDVLATSSTDNANAVIWKSKTANFYYFGDGGTTYYQGSSAPFLLDANKKPIIGNWGLTNTSANSVIIMNIVAKALMDSQ